VTCIFAAFDQSDITHFWVVPSICWANLVVIAVINLRRFSSEGNSRILVILISNFSQPGAATISPRISSIWLRWVFQRKWRFWITFRSRPE
jgi:hypothetical protein